MFIVEDILSVVTLSSRFNLVHFWF